MTPGLEKDGTLRFIILVLVLSLLCLSSVSASGASEKRKLEKEKARLIELKKKSEKAKRELKRTIREQKKLKKNVESLNSQLKKKERFLKRVIRELAYVEMMLDKYDRKITGLKKRREVLQDLAYDAGSKLLRKQASYVSPLTGFVESERSMHLLGLLLSRAGEEIKAASRKERVLTNKLDSLEGSRKYWENKDKSTRKGKQKIESIRKRRKKELKKVASKKAAIEKKYRRLERDISYLQKTVSSIERKVKAGRKRGRFVTTYPSNYTYPIKGRVISKYGRVKDRDFNIYIDNKGIEIKGNPGGNIRAVNNGKVVYQGNLSGFGQVIVIEHRGDIFSVYGRARLYNVRVGDKVAKGQKIGVLNINSSPLLYFELRVGGRPVNPLKYINIPRG